MSGPTSSPEIAEHDAWRSELVRILDSDCFAGANRISTLLQFVVDETLAGRGARLKEYVIGVEVLKCSEDFDPRIDTNVRTEAWRLRERLQRYYMGEGAGNPHRIELPRRTFVPVLRSVAAKPADDTLVVVPASAPASQIVLALQAFRESPEGGADIAGLGLCVVDELALELSDHPALRLVHVPSSTDFAASSQADWLLRGSVRLVGPTLRTVVHLVRPDGQEQLWSQGFEHRPQEMVDLPRVLARDIVRALITSPIAVSMGLNRPRPFDGIRGSFARSILSSGFERMAGDLERVRRQVRRIEAWLLHHPEDGAAKSQLATLLAWNICAAPAFRSEFVPLRQRCARDLLSAPSPSVDALVALGLASMVDFDWHGAVALLDAAVLAEPDCSDARVVRGLCALHLGDAVSAQHELELACRTDGQSPLAFATLGMLHFHQHRFPQAASAARHALSLDAHCEPAAVLLADSELSGGQFDEGIAILQRARSWSGRWPVLMGRLGHAYALNGREHLARTLLGELQQTCVGEASAHAAIADIHLGLGERDAALAELNQAVGQRILPDLLLLRSAPRYDGLRRDARFVQLIERMALPAAA
ncbi:tetratricopeptide repeat protein [Variovorax ginsengisoli]|uniref:Flp pilus assembly protein TadD n=1 Tax=Variovorax ginsengisoli TaxID=363844 RepID=A0ABT9S953_9BURK|nr:tetratricopeptide repeat protein [Variovorax ginsengisoli]MDP9900883.1 Flp pilus assembly protein TadD [Variovorax ginsengisoli]